MNFTKNVPNECLNIYQDFDETFVDAFPNALADRHCRIHKELSENEEVIFLNTHTEITATDSQLHVALKSNDSLGGTLQFCDKTVSERTKECASDRTSDNDNQLARQLYRLHCGMLVLLYMGVFIKNYKRF